MVQAANLQALLTRRSGKRCYAVLLLRLDAQSRASAFLHDLLTQITLGDAPEVAGTPLINIGLSWRAVCALVADQPDLDIETGRKQLEPFFVDERQAPDSAAMAGQLGFVGASAPGDWWTGFSTRDIDVALYVGCDAEAEREDLLGALRAAAARAGLAELQVTSFPGNTITGYLPAGGRLHFGYRDGITTPDVDWNGAGRPGSVNLREFVLGYRTRDYPTAPFSPGAWQDLMRDGSFACLTWIHQDVARFEAFLSTKAATVAHGSLADAKEWLAAQLVGRWRDGSPLSRYPDAPPPAPDLDDTFGFADDAKGARCPLGAHIRIVNSRDQPLSFANRSRFPGGPPRLIRRGFSYGPPLEGDVDDGVDRGLFGVFLCSRINEQFYTVLRWMQQTDFSEVFDRPRSGRNGQDNLTGSRLAGGENRSPEISIVGRSDQSGAPIGLAPFIRYRGVAALLLPSIAALRRLASA